MRRGTGPHAGRLRLSLLLLGHRLQLVRAALQVRPISDYWSLPDRTWVHVPYFGFWGCGCKTPPDGYEGPKLTHLPKADEGTSKARAPRRRGPE